jgi:hypothetical protein
MQVRIKVQLNTLLFSKTLVRKDVASSSAKPKDKDGAPAAGGDAAKPASDDDDFSSKAQVMTLMTTDVDRVSDVAWHLFSLVGMHSSERSWTSKY